MPIGSLSDIYEGVINLLEKFTSTKYWKVKAVLMLSLLSFLLASGQFRDFDHTFKTIDGWKAFEQKKENLFSQPQFAEASNAAKKTFRLTVPLIAKIFHLNNYAILICGWILNILFLFYSIVLIEKISSDKILALLTGIGLTFIYNGHAGFTDNNAWFDVFAYFFLLMAMLSPNIFLIFLFSTLAAWCDERAVVALGLIFIWWKLNELKSDGFSFASILKFKPKSSSVIIALLFYLIGRYLLTVYANLYTPLKEVGSDVLLRATDTLGLGIWSALEGFWILIIVCFFLLLSRKNSFAVISITGMMMLILLIAFSVQDITKSAAYLFPVIFISIAILADWFSKNDLRKLLLVCAVICFLFPSYYFAHYDHHAEWYKPILIRAIDYFKN